MMQPDLFTSPRPVRRLPGPLARDLFLARLRNEAMRVCMERGWVTSDDLRLYAQEHGLVAVSPKHWGGIFKQTGWVCVGQVRSQVPSNNGRFIRQWAWRG